MTLPNGGRRVASRRKPEDRVSPAASVPASRLRVRTLNRLSTMDLVKSKRRVADHGEVFTPAWLVEEMLDLVKHETERKAERLLDLASHDHHWMRSVTVSVKSPTRSERDPCRRLLIARLVSGFRWPTSRAMSV
jgi:hypothetical protein